MKRRLYFLLPDVASATGIANDLLLARVEDRHMHFLARRGAGLGLFLGALGGAVLASIVVNYPPEGTHPGLATAVVIALLGIVLGVWLGSMAATALPNSRLRQFDDEIQRGKVLLIVDMPYEQVDRIRQVVASRHPEVVLSAQETRYPAFP